MGYDSELDDDSLRYNKKCDIWSLGESCPACQELLFSNIKQCRLLFPDQHWAGISGQAKDLITRLLVKDSAARLTAEEVLSHPWIVNQGSTVVLHTPSMLNKYLEDFTTKILEAGRALGDVGQAGAVSPPLDIPARRTTMSFNL